MKDITFTEGSLIVNIPSNVTIEAAFQGFYLPIEMWWVAHLFLGINWLSSLGVGANSGWSVTAQISTSLRSDGITITL